MLPGTIAMAGAAANDESSITLSYIGAATSGGTSITAPGGIASGDLGIYLDYAVGSSPPSAVTPSGHTNFFSFTGGDGRVMISYKVLAGSETTITGMNGGTENNKVFLVYRPSAAITAVTPLTGSSWQKQIETAANPSAQATTLLGKSVPLIFLGLAGTHSGTPSFSTASPAFDGTHTGNELTVGRKLYNSAPQNHTVDMNDLGTNTLVSGYIQVN